MRKKFLLTTIMLILLTSCQPASRSTASENTPVNLVFEISEGNSLIEGEMSDPSEDVPGERVTLYGHLVDTGELNMFYVYSFDGASIFSKRYFLKNRIYKGTGQGIWAGITGMYSDPEYIDADTFEIIDEMDKKMEKAGKQACAWVEKNRAFYDLNQYKNTDRYKALGYSPSTDLNKVEFRLTSLTVFIDFKKMAAGFDCGSSVLGETPQRGDFLTYMAVYNLDKMRMIRVIIKNTGYFLE